MSVAGVRVVEFGTKPANALVTSSSAECEQFTHAVRSVRCHDISDESLHVIYKIDVVSNAWR